MSVHLDRAVTKDFAEAIRREWLETNGIGQISEIFDGDAPHASRGCIAQAWSVAEIARAYVEDLLDAGPKESD
jgi:glycogen debranching enzyme